MIAFRRALRADTISSLKSALIAQKEPRKPTLTHTHTHTHTHRRVLSTSGDLLLPLAVHIARHARKRTSETAASQPPDRASKASSAAHFLHAPLTRPFRTPILLGQQLWHPRARRARPQSAAERPSLRALPATSSWSLSSLFFLFPLSFLSFVILRTYFLLFSFFSFL